TSSGHSSIAHAMNYFNESRTQTSAERYIFASGTYKLLAFTIGTIGVLGFCNNAVVIILYYRFKRLRTPTNLLLANISASDLLVSVVGINFTFVSCVKQEWLWNSAACVWDGFSNSLLGQSICMIEINLRRCYYNNNNDFQYRNTALSNTINIYQEMLLNCKEHSKLSCCQKK
uniref:G-protein coupled receptors family 1 profile domain-containing protein n=1 Tax=Electrophorus electricus TaxID=8005 RepID=A0AAY5E856_ELEEL